MELVKRPISFTTQMKRARAADTQWQRDELRRKLAEVLAAIPITGPTDKQKQFLEALEFVIGSAYKAI